MTTPVNPYASIKSAFRASQTVCSLSLPKIGMSVAAIDSIYRSIAHPLGMEMICFDRERGLRCASFPLSGSGCDSARAVVFTSYVRLGVIEAEQFTALSGCAVYPDTNLQAEAIGFLPADESRLIDKSSTRTDRQGVTWVQIPGEGGWVVEKYELPKLGDPMVQVWGFMRDYLSLATNGKVLFVLNGVAEYLEGQISDSDFGKLVRQGLLNISEDFQSSHKRALILGEQISFDRTFASVVEQVSIALPSVHEFSSTLDMVLADMGKRLEVAGLNLSVNLSESEREEICHKASGLSLEEFSYAIRLEATSRYCIDADTITVIEKKQQESLRANKLDVIDLSRESIPAGLENFKSWCLDRKELFWLSTSATLDEDEMDIPAPKGALLLGLPGTGKSAMSKGLALLWGLPLVRLNLAAMKDSFVGQTTKNIRAALAAVEAGNTPKVLWVDEIDKAAAGAAADYQGDSGTSKELIGEFLTWMQEKTAPVFVCFCLTEDALVVGADGVPRSIKTLSDQESVLSIDWATGNVIQTQTNLKVNPLAKKVVKVKTSTTSFTGTPNHPVFVATTMGIQEVQLGDLTPGMFIARPRKLPEPSVAIHSLKVDFSVSNRCRQILFPSTLDEKLAQLIGFLIADGSFVFNQEANGFRLGFHDKKEDCLRIYADLAARLFGKVKVFPCQDKDSFYGYVDSYPVGLWFKQNFPELLSGKQSRSVPALIFQSSNKIVASFLRGFFDGDGTVKRGRISASGTNKRLLLEVGLLLHRLGIDFSKSEYPSRSENRQGVTFISIANQSEVSKFIDQVGFDFPYKQEETKNFKTRLKSKASTSDLIPVPWTLMDRLIAASGLKKLPDGYGSKKNAGLTLKRRVSRLVVSQWLEELNPSLPEYQQVEVILSLAWDFVSSVEAKDELTEVFDIRVPIYQNFIANGIVMHNTANNISKLEAAHPELFRAGRLDATFFVDLPDAIERQAILEFYLSRQRCDLTDKEMKTLLTRTEGLVGSELEQLVIAGMIVSSKAGRRKKGEMKLADLIEAREQIKPVADRMRSQVAELQAWAADNAIPASAVRPVEVASTTRKSRQSVASSDSSLLL